MHIQKVKIQNYRALRSAYVELKPGLNIVVGDNDCGKSTLLEAINLALTGQLDGRSIREQIHPYLFNADATAVFLSDIRKRIPHAPPEIRIEVYLNCHDKLVAWQGTINSERTDCPGLTLAIGLDEDLRDDYEEYIRHPERVTAIPVEYYTVTWFSFSNSHINFRRLPVGVRLIDTRSIPNERSPGRFVLDVINGHLSPSEHIELALAYRQMKESFTTRDPIRQINEKLATHGETLSTRKFSIAFGSPHDRGWQSGISTLLDDIPFSFVGSGEQSSVKVQLAMHHSSASDIFLIEEPENHLSYSRLNTLIHRLSEHGEGKQLVISTHSSFVLNKLGVDDILLFNRGAAKRIKDLEPDTRDYFQKQPGYSTLRLILAQKAILVEGPSDELIVQKAYLDAYGKLPLADGVDVISVGLSGPRFLEIACSLRIKVAVVGDNDGDPARARARYDRFAGNDNVMICIDDNADCPTLEDQIAHVNDIEIIRQILGIENPAIAPAVVAWMKEDKNKTTVALKMFETKIKFNFPKYITDAIAK